MPPRAERPAAAERGRSAPGRGSFQRDAARPLARVRAAVERIRDVVSHMQRITRLEPAAAPPGGLPRMLDIRRSGTEPESDAGLTGRDRAAR